MATLGAGLKAPAPSFFCAVMAYIYVSNYKNIVMANLSSFSQEERALIVSVPYRVGVWISNSDDNENSGMDDKRERQALEAAIARLAKAHPTWPFAAAVMSEVQSNKSMWATWGEQIAEDQVLSDVQKAIKICRGKVGKRQIREYKQTVWEMGIVVAQAYGEHIDPDNEMHLDRFFAWIWSFFGPPSRKKAPENMSPAEKTALKKLRAILKG